MSAGSIIAAALAGGAAGVGRGMYEAGKFTMEEQAKTRARADEQGFQERLQNARLEQERALDEARGERGERMQERGFGHDEKMQSARMEHASELQRSAQDFQDKMQRAQHAFQAGQNDEARRLQRELTDMAAAREWAVGGDGYFYRKDGTLVTVPILEGGRKLGDRPLKAPDYLATGVRPTEWRGKEDLDSLNRRIERAEADMRDDMKDRKAAQLALDELNKEKARLLRGGSAAAPPAARGGFDATSRPPLTTFMGSGR